MPGLSEYTPGTFTWADLATSDSDGAKAFYSALFGWNTKDEPAGDAGVYTLCDIGGKQVCGLYAISEEMTGQGIPPHWQSYVYVENVDNAVGKVAELGGNVLMPPMDVMEAGRMAMAQDPTGAVLALWQPKEHFGAQLAMEPGTVCWNELHTNDVRAAESYYTALFGWSSNSMSAAEGVEYTMFNQGEINAGGMMQIQEDWGEVPPNWSIYFSVVDCDESVTRATSLGASIVVPAMEVDVGKFAYLQDPQGAILAVMQFKQA